MTIPIRFPFEDNFELDEGSRLPGDRQSVMLTSTGECEWSFHVERYISVATLSTSAHGELGMGPDGVFGWSTTWSAGGR